MNSQVLTAPALLIGLLAGALAQAADVAAPKTPAELGIERARTSIQQAPGDYAAYNRLAMALTRRAREIAEPKLYEQALAVLQKSAEIAPKNYEGRRIAVWAKLGLHEFEEALALAQELNREFPDDVLVYGLLTDAHVELGNYAEAEEATNWMLRLRPGNLPAMSRAAYMRELFGNMDGAVELLVAAVQSTHPRETEDQAWLLAHIGHLHLSCGRLEAAEQALLESLRRFPAYHYSLGYLAQVKALQGEHAEAEELLRERYAVAPHPENLYDVGRAVLAQGREAEAQELFDSFLEGALAESGNRDNANRSLVEYYAERALEGHADAAAEALRIAELEIARRRDVHTLEIHAWALFVNDQFDEARADIDEALTVGIRDARMLYRAGVIAAAQGDDTAAVASFKAAVRANPVSAEAKRATERLAELEG